MVHTSPLAPLLALSLSILSPADAQKPSDIPNRWLVEFRARSFDLSEFRAAHRARDAERVATIVANLQALARKDQEPFRRAVAKLGGRVTDQFWIVNACALQIDKSKIDLIRALPNVHRITSDKLRAPLVGKSTNLINHNSDAVNANGFKGANVGVAILDTGLDADMNNRGRPHRCFYPDGDLSQPHRIVANYQIGSWAAEDVHGHGTAIAGVACGGNWGTPHADHGHAPHSDVVGYCIVERLGGYTSDATMTRAWQQVAADAVRHNIRVANNSYAGDPNPLSVPQQALDSCALNADVLICVSAGNASTVLMFSQSCANGIAVGAVSPGTHKVASFSAIGPLHGDAARFYPDITACGVDIVMPKIDDENEDTINGGTSAASPQVAGAAALLRSAVPTLTAIETKAILLASAVDISRKNSNAPFNSRNAYGVGLLRDDYAMNVALQTTGRGKSSVTKTNPAWSQTIQCTQGRTYRFSIAWMREVMSSNAWSDLDVEVRLGSTVVGSSRTTRNLYEVVQWTASATGTYSVNVSAPRIEQTRQDFGWASMQVVPEPTAGKFYSFGNGCHRAGPGGHVLPAWNLKQMGNIANSLPFSAADKRYQQVFDSDEIPLSASLLLGLALRQDDRIPVRGTGTQRVKITLGYSSYGPNSLTNDFAANMIAGTEVVVFDGVMQLPNLTGTNPDPFEFAVQVNFTTPFPFVKTPGRNLILEVVNTSASSVSLTVDAARGSGVRSARLFATTATATTSPYLAHNYGVVMKFLATGKGLGPMPWVDVIRMPQIDHVLQVDLHEAPLSAAAALLIGTSNSQWGGNSLPFDMGVFGAPGCDLLTSSEFVVLTTTDATGKAAVPIPIPNNRALIGASAYTQFAIQHAATNSLGLVFSRGGAISVGGRR